MRRWLICAAVVGAALPLVPATAEASSSYRGPVVAVAPNGRAVGAWLAPASGAGASGRAVLRVATGSTATGLHRARTIFGAANELSIDINAHGDAVLVWSAGASSRSHVVVVDHRSRVRTLMTPAGFAIIDAAIDRSARVTLVGVRTGNGLYVARSRSGARRFGQPRRVAAGDVISAAVDVDGRGDGLIAAITSTGAYERWPSQPGPLPTNTLSTLAISAAGRLGPQRRMVNSPMAKRCDEDNPDFCFADPTLGAADVGIDAHGRAAMTWESADIGASETTADVGHVAVGPRTGRLHLARSTPMFSPQLAMSARGDVLVAGSHTLTSDRTRLVAVLRRAGQQRFAVHTRVVETASMPPLAAAVSSRGRAVIAAAYGALYSTGGVVRTILAPLDARGASGAARQLASGAASLLTTYDVTVGIDDCGRTLSLFSGPPGYARSALAPGVFQARSR